MVGLSRQTSRPTHHGNASKLAKIRRKEALSCDRWMFQIKLQVTWNKQIEQPVVVIITPGRSGRPSLQCYPGLLGDVGESAVVVVVLQAVPAVDGQPNVVALPLVAVSPTTATSPNRRRQ